MSHPVSKARRFAYLGGGVAIAVAVGVGTALFGDDCEICEAATTLVLQSTVPVTCSVNVNTDAAAGNLNLTATGSQHIQVGTAVQSCNKKVGYTLGVASANCATAPAGAKIVDTVSTETLGYSVEFVNPATGGSTADVTGLLASTCAGQTGRNVTNAKVTAETTTVFVNFTGNSGLAAGTYQDTLTVTMSVK